MQVCQRDIYSSAGSKALISTKRFTMRFYPPYMLFSVVLALSVSGCAVQDDNNANPHDGKKQDLTDEEQTSTAENRTSPREGLEPEFPNELDASMPLYYAVHNGFLSICLEGGEIMPYEVCDFTPPSDWEATTALATVTEATHLTNEPCVVGEEYLGSHFEVSVQIHTTLRGPSAPETITLLYPTLFEPELLEGEHILATFIEDRGRYFMLSSVYVEDSPSKFESDRPGPDQVPSTEEKRYVRLPDTYGDLVEVFDAMGEGDSRECTGWANVERDNITTRLFRVDDSCKGTSVSGGNHQPDAEDQTGNNTSGD